MLVLLTELIRGAGRHLPVTPRDTPTLHKCMAASQLLVPPLMRVRPGGSCRRCTPQGCRLQQRFQRAAQALAHMAGPKRNCAAAVATHATGIHNRGMRHIYTHNGCQYVAAGGHIQAMRAGHEVGPQKAWRHVTRQSAHSVGPQNQVMVCYQ